MSVGKLRLQINLNRASIRNEFLRVGDSMKKYSRLGLWDGGASTGPQHMANDEAMARLAPHPVLRWYRWSRAEITFGYPQRWRDVAALAAERPAVRRWTGGGIVEHGEDLTVALVVPASENAEAPIPFYERVHRAIAAALGSGAHLATAEECSCGAACFENPARYDVLQGARKIVGGALRRTRDGMLYQGSIQTAEIPADFIARLAGHLAASCSAWIPDEAVSRLADELHGTRYATEAWLTNR